MYEVFCFVGLSSSGLKFPIKNSPKSQITGNAWGLRVCTLVHYSALEKHCICMCPGTGTRTGPQQDLAKESYKEESNNIRGKAHIIIFQNSGYRLKFLIILKGNRKGLFSPASKPHPSQFLTEFSPKPTGCREKYQSQKK